MKSFEEQYLLSKGLCDETSLIKNLSKQDLLEILKDYYLTKSEHENLKRNLSESSQQSLIRHLDKEKKLAILKSPVNRKTLPVKIANILKCIDVDTVEKLAKVTEEELRKYRNVGDRFIITLKEFLYARGLKMGMTDADISDWLKTERQA